MKHNFRKPGLVYPSQATLALAQPAPSLPGFRPARYRALTATTTREQRRALRAAEQAAWEAASPSTELRARAAQATADSPLEKFLFTALFAAAAAGVVWGLLDSFNLIERWPAWVAALRQLLG